MMKKCSDTHTWINRIKSSTRIMSRSMWPDQRDSSMIDGCIADIIRFFLSWSIVTCKKIKRHFEKRNVLYEKGSFQTHFHYKDRKYSVIERNA